jgi:hypothetical protein
MPTFVSSGAWGAVKRKRNKYNAVAQEERTFKGVKFGSKIEMARGAELMTLMHAGRIEQLAWHPKFPVIFHGELLCTYTADSMYLDKLLDKTIIEEVKSNFSRLDQYYRLRRKAAEIYHNMKVTEIVR